MLETENFTICFGKLRTKNEPNSPKQNILISCVGKNVGVFIRCDLIRSKWICCWHISNSLCFVFVLSLRWFLCLRFLFYNRSFQAQNSVYLFASFDCWAGGCSLIRVIKQEISGETQAKRYDAQKSINCWSVFIPNFLWQAASTFQHPTTNDQRVDYRRQNM